MKLKFLLTIIILFVILPACSFAAPQDNLYPLFSQANEAFRQANAKNISDEQRDQLFSQAIELYNRIITDGGIKNARLYYNLANAHLMKGQLGEAILNYRRAEQIDSTDPDIQKNLSYARSRRIDMVPVQTEKKILQTIFFWHQDMSIKAKFITALIGFAAFFVLLSIAIWHSKLIGLKPLIAVSCLTMLIFTASSAISYYQSLHTSYGVITADEVTARQGDGESYPPSFKEPLHEGTEFELLEQRKNWWKIELANGHMGWIPRSSAGKV